MVSALICMQMTPVYGLCRRSPTLELQNSISTCIDDVTRWMRSNRLQLNTAKTEVLWSTSSRRFHLPPVSPIRVGTDQVMPVSFVHSLGIYMDADVSMMLHVSKTVAACFAILRQLRSIRRSVKRSVLQSLVSSLVLRRLDYCNAALAVIHSHLIKRMQSVMNSAAREVYSASRYDRITPLLSPHTAALAEGSGVDRVQTSCSGIQMPSSDSTAVFCSGISPVACCR